MEFGRRAVNSAKMILRLESKCEQLQRENFYLKEQVMAAKGNEEEMKEKRVKLKDKYVELKEKLSSEERKWREEELKIMDKCRQLGVEKRKLEIDLKAAMSSRADGSDDVAEKLKAAEAEAEALKSLLEEQDDTITALSSKNEYLELHFSRLQMDFEIKLTMETKNLKMEEEKNLVLTRKIQVLEGEKRELEVEVCLAKMEKSDEISNILNEKNALKEKHLEEISNLVSRTSVLEREKHELEAETREKDERIKVLVQEKERLIGPKSVDVSVTEPKESSDVGSQLRELLGSKVQKRKVEGLGCSVENQDGTKRKRCKLDDMFNAFSVNDELCMRSVCALYRKYHRLGNWKNRLISSNNRGFMQPYETRGMALGELLTSGDPEGRLKMSLVELEQADPCGLEDCRFISWEHEKKLFEIYMNNLDPLFTSGDDINPFFSSC